MNQMNNRRELTPAQRRAKNERDRRRRRERNMEYARLQMLEADSTTSLVRLRNENTELRENQERQNSEVSKLNSEVSKLTNVIHQQRQQMHQQRQQISKLQEMEYARLQMSEADSTTSLVRLRNENTELRENQERLNYEVSKFTNIIHQQRQQILKLQETLNQVDSWINLDNFPSPNEEVANNDPITQCPGSSQSAKQFADDVIAKYCSTFKPAAAE